MTAVTLAAEHTELMRDVRRRVAPAMALLDARTWPRAELVTLLTHVRTAVLGQLTAEEELLYPAGVTIAPLAELSADHVKLHRLAERLAAVIEVPCGFAELRHLLVELVATLGQHLLEEEAVLAALAGVEDDLPSIAELTARVAVR